MTKSQLVEVIQNVDSETGTSKHPMIVTNHTYDVIGSYVPKKRNGGGEWLKSNAYYHLS